jgi:Ca2+-binding RTX toxin-like protein
MTPELFEPVGYSVLVEPGEQISFRLGDGTTSQGTLFEGPTFPDDDQFHHVAITVDRDAANGVRIYLDGQVSVAGSAAALGSLSNPFDFEMGFGAFNQDGIVDEVSLYRRALGPEEIAALFLADTSGKCGDIETCAEQPSGMVAWWRAEDGSDTTTVSDSKGTNHGTRGSEIAYVPGKVGDAFYFDPEAVIEDDLSIIVPDSTSLDVTNAFTIDAWIDPAELNDATRIIVQKGDPSLAFYRVLITADGAMALSIRTSSLDDDEFFLRFATADDVIKTSEWQHVAFTFDSSATPRVTMYRNGVLQESEQTSGTLAGGAIANAEPLIVGSENAAGTPDRFGGLMDEVELFNRALTEEEILSIFLAGANGKCVPQLVQQGTLELRKDLNPNNLPGRFNLTITDSESQTIASVSDVGDNGTTGEQTVEVGTYTVRETAGTGTTLSNYQTSILCRNFQNDGSPISATPAGPGAWTVQIGHHDDVVCTITNSITIPAQCKGMVFDAYILGTEGNDTLTGTGLRELILGNNGNDVLSGGAGNDCIAGGVGNDTHNGGSGNDRLIGDGGNDTLKGDSGTDAAIGGANTDNCDAESETTCES